MRLPRLNGSNKWMHGYVQANGWPSFLWLDGQEKSGSKWKRSKPPVETIILGKLTEDHQE